MTLVALLALTTHAWATDASTVFELSGSTASVGTLELGTNVSASQVKIHSDQDNINCIKLGGTYSYANGKYFTIAPASGSFKKGDKVSIAVCCNHDYTSETVAKAVIYAADGSTLLYTTSQGINGNNSAGDPVVEEFELTQDAEKLYIGRLGKQGDAEPVSIYVTTLKVTGARAQDATGTPVPHTWDATAKTVTLTNGMPAGNVTVSVEYFPQAAFAMSTDATPVALAPKASTSARANTDDPLVEGGTVGGIVDEEAFLEEGQGTLLYHFSATQLDAAALEALTATDWTDKLPTADGLSEGTVYVYYYIKGADDLPGITPGAKFTFSDSDIQELVVTLAPEPTYNVEFAEGTNPEAPAEPIWTASPATGVKKGTEVTVTYTGSKKVLGVKAEKKAAEKTITIGTQNYTVQNGETWKQFITRNQLSNWSVKDVTLITWGVFMDEPYSELHVSSDGNNWTQLVLSSQDAPIDTDKQYKWVQEEIGSGGVSGGGVSGGEPLF